MKKLNFFRTFVLLAASMLLFSSCQKDPEDLLIGKWQIVASEDGYLLPDGSTEDVLYNEVVGVQFDFREDGTVSIMAEGELNVFKWVYADNVVSFEQDGEVVNMEIKSIDKEKMSGYVEESYEDECFYSKWDFMKIE